MQHIIHFIASDINTIAIVLYGKYPSLLVLWVTNANNTLTLPIFFFVPSNENLLNLTQYLTRKEPDLPQSPKEF